MPNEDCSFWIRTVQCSENKLIWGDLNRKTIKIVRTIAELDNVAPDMCIKIFQKKKTKKVQQLLPQFASACNMV